MRGYQTFTVVGLVILAALTGSCKKDEATAPAPTTPALTAAPPGVTVSGTTSQDVTIANGTHPYIISQQPISSLATAHFVDANLDTAVLVISGVSTATGSTSVVVKDASSPQRSVAVGITKTP